MDHFHALVHADDTLIMSTNRDGFIHKCNQMMIYFEDNQLKLNLSKSSYLIINPSIDDKKCSIKLEKGLLEYKHSQYYLGIIISDDGLIGHDVDSFIKGKRSNLCIKFNNFCSKNSMAPLDVKISVLDSCLASSLSYANETWADRGRNIETLYRQGLRTALGVRQSVNNEIIYIETDKFPLKCRIMKQQLKFWLIVKEYINNNPDSALYSFVKQAQFLNFEIH